MTEDLKLSKKAQAHVDNLMSTIAQITADLQNAKSELERIEGRNGELEKQADLNQLLADIEVKSFNFGDNVICFNGSGFPEYCIVVDTSHAPFYTLRTENGSGKILNAAVDDIFSCTVIGLLEVKAIIKNRILALINEVEKIDLLIKSAEEK